jgi:hypothetical protein
LHLIPFIFDQSVPHDVIACRCLSIHLIGLLLG